MKNDRPPHYLREWRQHRALTLVGVVERGKALLEDRLVAEGEEASLKRIGLSQSNLTRIERFELPYNERLLEVLAEIYDAEVPDLIIRNPTEPEGIWSIYDQIPVPDRPQALRVIKSVVDGLKTGTDG